MNVWELLFDVKRCLWFVKCFFVGHELYYEDEYLRLPVVCEHCFFSERQMNLEDGFTMPDILSRAYTRLCDKNWHWFDVLDEWLYRQLRRWIKMPRWWEY